MKRRTFIKLSAISAAGMVLPLQLEGEGAAMPQLKPNTLITPNADFYILQIGEPAVLDAATWRMAITGLIEKTDATPATCGHHCDGIRHGDANPEMYRGPDRHGTDEQCGVERHSVARLA